MVQHNAHQSLKMASIYIYIYIYICLVGLNKINLKMALPGELVLSEVGPLAAEMQLPFV